MNAPHRFLFDRSFDQPEGPRAAPRPAPAPEPTFSKGELEAALARGVEQGRAAALAEAQQSLEARDRKSTRLNSSHRL